MNKRKCHDALYRPDLARPKGNINEHTKDIKKCIPFQDLPQVCEDEYFEYADYQNIQSATLLARIRLKEEDPRLKIIKDLIIIAACCGSIPYSIVTYIFKKSGLSEV